MLKFVGARIGIDPRYSHAPGRSVVRTPIHMIYIYIGWQGLGESDLSCVRTGGGGHQGKEMGAGKIEKSSPVQGSICAVKWAV